MSIIAILLFAIFSAYLVTRFGNQVLARDSTSWWFILLFLGIGVLSPTAYQSLAKLLGITLVSNFVFAALILFLLKVTLEGAMRSTQVLRKLRDAMTSEAGDRFTLRAKFLGNPQKPRVIVMLPAYNESQNIELMANSLRKHGANLDRDWQWTACFVNDGSQDDTKAKLQQWMPDNFVSHPSNFGVSAVLMTGFKAALALDCSYLVQCDADGQHPVECIGDLLSAAGEAQADLTIGSRFVPTTASTIQSYRESTTFARRIGSRLISFSLFSFGSRAAVHDPTSGFRIYSRQAMEFLVRHMPDDYPEPESIALCALRGLKIKEVPVSMLQRQGGESSITGRKSVEFMIKVFTALLSLRLRFLISGGRLAR